MEGTLITSDVVRKAVDDEIASIKAKIGDTAFAKTKYLRAREYLLSTTQGKDYAEFLTTQMYDDLVVLSKGESRL